MTQQRIKDMLNKPAIQKGKPLSLSTEQATEEKGEIAPSHHRTSTPTEQQKAESSGPKRIKRGYALREDLIKGCKQVALDTDRLLYEVMEEALERYLEKKEETTTPGQVTALENELQQLKAKLDLERRFRSDTQARHFKKWLRGHDRPQESDFVSRFLADTRLPQHASRGMYEAKLRICGYSEEDIHLFEGLWKDMLFVQA